MSIVNDEPLMDREGSGNLYQESEKLLRLAEGLQDRCEQYERRLWMLLWLGATLIAAVVGFSVYVSSAFPQDSLPGRLATFFSICYSAATGAFLAYMRLRITRQAARDRRALHSIVDMLRGLEKGIAEKDNLSTLERAEFRIRLSRFDIGPG